MLARKSELQIDPSELVDLPDLAEQLLHAKYCHDFIFHLGEYDADKVAALLQPPKKDEDAADKAAATNPPVATALQTQGMFPLPDDDSPPPLSRKHTLASLQPSE